MLFFFSTHLQAVLVHSASEFQSHRCSKFAAQMMVRGLVQWLQPLQAPLQAHWQCVQQLRTTAVTRKAANVNMFLNEQYVRVCSWTPPWQFTSLSYKFGLTTSWADTSISVDSTQATGLSQLLVQDELQVHMAAVRGGLQLDILPWKHSNKHWTDVCTTLCAFIARRPAK